MHRSDCRVCRVAWRCVRPCTHGCPFHQHILICEKLQNSDPFYKARCPRKSVLTCAHCGGGGVVGTSPNTIVDAGGVSFDGTHALSAAVGDRDASNFTMFIKFTADTTPRGYLFAKSNLAGSRYYSLYLRQSPPRYARQTCCVRVPCVTPCWGGIASYCPGTACGFIVCQVSDCATWVWCVRLLSISPYPLGCTSTTASWVLQCSGFSTSRRR